MSEGIMGVEQLLQSPVDREELRHASFVVDSARLLFVQTPKAACTAMKHYLLAVQHLSGSVVTASTIPLASQDMLVHDRDLFPAPSLTDLDPSTRREVLASPDWLRMCFVRNPYARLFAAWQDKLLVREPTGIVHELGLGVLRGGRLNVRRAFGDFVRDLADEPDRFFADWHFRSQHQLLRPNVIPYTDIVRVEELATFLPRLESHLRRQGNSHPPTFPHLNRGLGLEWRDCYDEESIHHVQAIYADDFDAFGYDVELEPGEKDVVIDSIGLTLLHGIWARNERIAALAETAADIEESRAERSRYLQDHNRLIAERQHLLAEHALAHAEARRVTEENEALRTEHEELVAQLDALAARIDDALTDRDRVLLLLLDSEQELAERGERLAFPASGHSA